MITLSNKISYSVLKKKKKKITTCGLQNGDYQANSAQTFTLLMPNYIYQEIIIEEFKTN